MPETVRPAPAADLAGLIPAPRAAASGPAVSEPAVSGPLVPEPAARPGADVTASSAPGPERLAFLWAMLGALVGATVVGAFLLVLLTLLP